MKGDGKNVVSERHEQSVKSYVSHCNFVCKPVQLRAVCFEPVFMKNSVHIPVTLPASHTDDFRSISLFSPVIGVWFQIGHDVVLPRHYEHCLTCLFNYAVQTATLSYVSTKFIGMW